MRPLQRAIKARKPPGLPGYNKIREFVRSGDFGKAASLVRRELTKTETAAEFNRWTFAANAFGLARQLQSSPKKWKAFRSDGFFGYRPNEDAYLRAACQYLYGAKDGKLGQLARRDARDMMGCWEDRRWTAKKMFTRLHQPERGGFLGLPQAAKPSAKRRKPDFLLHAGEADTSVLDALQIGEQARVLVERFQSGTKHLKIVAVGAPIKGAKR